MKPSATESLPASCIPELLLGQYPGCAWVLRRSHEFHLVFGDTFSILGRSTQQLTGMNFADIFAPEARPSWTRRVESVFSGQTVCATARPGEAAAACSITLFPVRLPEGEIVFAGGIAQRIMESNLVLRILRAQEAERARISRLLHDRVGQHLSAAGLQLDLLRMDLADSAFPISQRTAEIQGMLETVVGLVRDLNHELNPALAERMGLRAALDGLAGRLRSDFHGTVRLLADPAAKPPAEAAAALYRIAQESARNAVRHSGCSAIEILLKSVRSGTALEIRDNGKGFHVSEDALHRRGLGFLVMERYAEQAGIDLEIDSAPGKGTVVRARFRTPENPGVG